MSDSDLLSAAVLRRKAVVYVRQSSQTQVQVNLESQRRQYDLVEEARRRGFQHVEVIDDCCRSSKIDHQNGLLLVEN